MDLAKLDMAIGRLDALSVRFDRFSARSDIDWAKAKEKLKHGATTVGRGLQKASGPLAVGGIAGGLIPGPVGLGALTAGVGGGFAAAKIGRGLEKAATGKVKHSTIMGGLSTSDKKAFEADRESSKNYKKTGQFTGEKGKLLREINAGRSDDWSEAARQAAAKMRGGVGTVKQAVQGAAGEAGKRFSNWRDRGALKRERGELDWALGGELDARRMQKEGTWQPGYVRPGDWARDVPMRQRNISQIEKRIAGRGPNKPFFR